MKSGDMKCAAETAELRKPGRSRPQTRTDAGGAVPSTTEQSCGRSAEGLRKRSLSSLSRTTRPAATPPTAADAGRLSAGKVRGAEKCGAKRTPAPSSSGGDVRADAVIAAALAILDARMRSSGPVLDCPGAVRQFLRLTLAEREREAFLVLFLDNQHQLIAHDVMFEGTLTCTAVYPREVVRRALALNAAAVILSHNHPSGTAEPSRADEHLTQQLKAALALVDVRVLDHCVVGGRCVVSFAESGRL